MRPTLRTMGLLAVLTVGGLLMTPAPSRAQCGGGGGYGRAWGGHTFNPRVLGGSGGYSGGYGSGGCGMMMGGMSMGGMAMEGMPMPATPAPAASIPGMNINDNAAPAAAPAPASPAASPAAPAATAPTSANATYYCPMHPGVMSTFPATCPYCHMALKRR